MVKQCWEPHLSFGERLQSIRKRQRWSRAGLAERVSCSEKAILLWEAGERIPGSNHLDALARALDVSMDYLWRGR